MKRRLLLLLGLQFVATYAGRSSSGESLLHVQQTATLFLIDRRPFTVRSVSADGPFSLSSPIHGRLKRHWNSRAWRTPEYNWDWEKAHRSYTYTRGYTYMPLNLKLHAFVIWNLYEILVTASTLYPRSYVCVSAWCLYVNTTFARRQCFDVSMKLAAFRTIIQQLCGM